MTQEQTPQSQTATATTDEAGSLDAAALAFEQRAEPKPEGAPVEAEAETQEIDPNAEAGDGQTDEDTDHPSELVSVEFDGQKYEVPPALEKALLRQADYSRKMNEVSAKEKAAAQRLETVTALSEGIEKYADVKASLSVIDRQLTQYEALDWQALRRDNPAEYAALAADLQTLRMNKADALAKAKDIGGEVEQAKQKTLMDKRAEMDSALKAQLKGWGEEMGVAITSYAQKAGVQRETLLTLTDPAMVVALEKARKYDELKAGKDALRSAPKPAATVIKPGAPRQTDPKTDAMARLRKTNTVDDAAAAFLSRMR